MLEFKVTSVNFTANLTIKKHNTQLHFASTEPIFDFVYYNLLILN